MRISKQAFHQRLNRHLGMQEELGYLLQIVREIRDDHPKMSVRKIYRMIRPKTIGRDRFEAFCFDSGLAVVVPKNYRRTTNSLGVTRFPNLVIGLKISRPNQVWVSDITYFELAGKWCYLTFIIDIYARIIIGFTASKELCAEQTSIPAFKMAIRFRRFLNHKITGVIFHSDGGGQYHSKKFLELTCMHSFKNSTAYDVYENPFAERVNGIIKNEYLIPYGADSFERLKKLLPKAVSLYNYERPHGSLLFDTPISFENKFYKNRRQKA
ncbi:DDE-type integrase/transposase/recombinase [Leptospira santarosai]|uniref:DDE-type integrase/transposase/recombinase n=1 Tax=Leptospira santarosai TaxID=28183 RepID=UPI0024AFB6BE|nr:DDE-type integrase/transposase/recombinase [Leptospira santarosai]MDI7198438.1 DDE-type integrase/transposase/recombinase [Leptospira santarosai]